MPGIFQEGTISVFPLAQGPPLPLALHVQPAASRQMAFNVTELLVYLLAKSLGKNFFEFFKTDSERL